MEPGRQQAEASEVREKSEMESDIKELWILLHAAVKPVIVSTIQGKAVLLVHIKILPTVSSSQFSSSNWLAYQFSAMPAYFNSMAHVLFLLLGVLAISAQAKDHCRCFPGDPCWPSIDEWSRFNRTIGGRLVATVPLASPCHAPNYNPKECATLKNEWLWPQPQ